MNQIQSPLMSQSAHDNASVDVVIDLRHYWNIVWREKWGIAGLVAIVSVMTVVILSNMTPIYESTATMLIEAKEANVVSIEEVYGIDSSQREYFATQFEILNSRSLAGQVVDQFALTKNPEFDPRQQKPLFDYRRYIPFLPEASPLAEVQARHSVLNKFRNALSVQPVRNTQLVKISFESADPNLTHKVANALGNAYIDNHLESRLAQTQKASDWLTSRLGGMREDLERAERELQSYRERENLVDVAGVATITTREIEENQQRLAAARSRATELKSQYEVVGSTTGRYDERWETLPGVLQDVLAQRLKETEGEAAQNLSELSKRYGPKHPKYIAAQSNFDESLEVFRRQVRKVVSGFAKAYSQAVSDQQALSGALEESKRDIQGINRKRYELSQLEREVQTSRQLYNLFFTRFKETNSAAFAAANARFVDQAVIPFSPVKPRKTLILLLAMILAGAVGVMLAFARDMLDNTIKSAGEIEAKLNQAVIGVLPRVERAGDDSLAISEAVLDRKEKTFAEAVKTARTGVMLSGIDTPLKRLVVTSSIPSEGKTTTSMNLAFAFGQMEKVVLLDGDMRRPSVAGNCGLTNRSPGLSNIIAGTEDLDTCTYPYQGIDVIPAGIVPPNPLELLSSERFGELLKVLADKYDRVIIDSAPTQAVSDSLVLSSHVDGVIYVVKSDATPTEVAESGLNRLLRVNANVLGVVLNQFDASHAAKYGGYGKGYYDYYGYGSDKAY